MSFLNRVSQICIRRFLRFNLAAIIHKILTDAVNQQSRLFGFETQRLTVEWIRQP